MKGCYCFTKSILFNAIFSCEFFGIFKNNFFIDRNRWLLFHRKKLKNVLSYFLQSSFPWLKKISNILCIFSLPHFAFHYRKLSQEMYFILPVFYTMLRAGRSKKEATNYNVLSLSTSQQTHQRWINVETTLIVNVHRRCFNVDIWLKWKLSRRMFADIVSTLTKQRWNNVNRSISIQRWWFNVV